MNSAIKYINTQSPKILRIITGANEITERINYGPNLVQKTYTQNWKIEKKKNRSQIKRKRVFHNFKKMDGVQIKGQRVIHNLRKCIRHKSRVRECFTIKKKMDRAKIKG